MPRQIASAVKKRRWRNSTPTLILRPRKAGRGTLRRQMPNLQWMSTNFTVSAECGVKRALEKPV